MMNEKALDDYIVLWYDEENYTFVEMETKYDEVNGTISTETTHFSRYMIVDKTAWFEAWSEELNYTNVQYEKSACYTVLAVDCSGSMSSSDPITIIADTSYPYINIRDCKRHDAVVNYVGAMDSDDKAAIVAFDSSATTLCGMTDSKLELSYAARKFYSSGGTNYNNVLTESIAILDNSEGSTRKKIVLLSDGKASVSDSVLESAKSSNIKIYTVGLGNSSDSVLQNIADETGGEFFKAYTADELVDIYEEIGVAVDIDTTDTDGDGLYDVYETAGMRLQNGKIIYTDPLLKDTDGDGLEDGQEIDPEMKQLYASGMPSDVAEIQPYYFVMYSDPNSEDGDSDGILDNQEVNSNYESYYSNPLLKDSDYDGIVDFSDPQPLMKNKMEEINWETWSEINLKEYMEKRNITEVIFKGVHSVKFGNYHTSVLVFASTESDYYDSEHFTQIGEDWSDNWKDIHYVTLGAGPGWGLSGDPLTADYNRPKDIQLDIKVQMINLTTSSVINENIDMLLENHEYYKKVDDENLPSYNLFPGNENEQNSNSYAVGLLNASGIDDLGEPIYNVPGYEYPLASSYFGREE